MWFQVELPQPAMVSNCSSSRRPTGGGRGGRGAGAPGAARRQLQSVGYPRGYTVQVSLDGQAWSKPIAEGKGEGSRTSITFTPTRAKFLRISQTETVPDAPTWSISGLRVSRSPGRHVRKVASRAPGQPAFLVRAGLAVEMRLF